MDSLREHLKWTRIPIPAGSAVGTLDLCIGEVGSGGPLALITAGVHGDEGPWGAWALHHLLETTDLSELRGTLRVVPVSNPLAMQADLRNAPVDQLDLNRVFPGSPSGSYSEALAHTLTIHALDGASVVIDLHGGGSWCVNSFVFRMEGGEILSDVIPAPFVVKAPDRTVTLTGYARSKGAVTTAIEMGGRSVQEAVWARRIADGLRRALAAAGIIEPAYPLDPLLTPAQLVGETTVLRPKAGGIFRPDAGITSLGTIVPKDTVLGRMLHPVTHDVLEEFRAPFEQTALLLLRPMLAQIEGGAMTYVVAQPEA